MASFREHVTFSSLLGLGYGGLSVVAAGYTPQQGILAGCLAGIGGMLPDLDLPTGKPGREVFSLTAAIVPLFLVNRVQRLFHLPNEAEVTILCIVAMYVAIRYGLAWVVARFSVHRGMFHSYPAMVIAGEVVYLSYPSPFTTVKLLMGGGVAVGFLSHLLLDELWSVKWNGLVPELKKSSGTAMKMVGEQFFPNAITFALLATLSFLVLDEAGLIVRPADGTAPMAEEETETATAPAGIVIREATLPEELRDLPATTLGAPEQNLQSPDFRFNMETNLGTPAQLNGSRDEVPPAPFPPLIESRAVPAPGLDEVFSNPASRSATPAEPRAMPTTPPGNADFRPL